MGDRDSRDKRRPRTPPAGVRAQTATPADEPQSWDDEVTPLPEDPKRALAQVDRRVKTTGIGLINQSDLLRAELNRRIDSLSDTVAQLSSTVTQLSSTTAAAVARLDVVMADRQIERQESSAVLVETTRTELEIRKSRALAEVAEEAAQRGLRRVILLKAVAGVGAIWGTISALLLAAKGCPR